MFKSCGKSVLYLKRFKFGDIILDNNIGAGMYRKLNDNEMQFVKEAIANEKKQ